MRARSKLNYVVVLVFIFVTHYAEEARDACVDLLAELEARLDFDDEMEPLDEDAITAAGTSIHIPHLSLNSYHCFKPPSPPMSYRTTCTNHVHKSRAKIACKNHV